jgi:hypothetical protein
MYQDFTILTGFGSKPIGAGMVVSVSSLENGSALEFKAGDAIKHGLTDPLVTTNGMTVGQMNRKALHDALDAWLDQKISQIRSE